MTVLIELILGPAFIKTYKKFVFKRKSKTKTFYILLERNSSFLNAHL
jgi:hypothetical protein